MKQLMYLITLVGSVFVSDSGFAAILRVPQNYPSIMWAVSVARTGDEILVACGTYAEWNIQCTNKNITIRGAGSTRDCVIVDAHQQNTHLTFANSESRIENITFINGGIGDGAVYVGDQCRIEIVNCAFKNNTHRVGGGLYVRPVGASVYLDTVFFENNHATLYGGGIGCDGQLYMIRCSFTGNSAGVYGGAVYLLASRPSFIYTTTIAENTSPEGGGIYYGGAVNIMDCSIYNNSANIGAGFRATNGSQLYAFFTDFNDPSYYCAGGVALLHCCVYPAWMCGQVDNSECAPVGEELTSWGTVKALFR